MRTTTALLSMWLLTGGLYASNVGATGPVCDCRDTCAREYRAGSADASVNQSKDRLACRVQTAQDRTTCTVEYLQALDACKSKGCGPDYAACHHKAVDDRSTCTASLHSEAMECLTDGTATYRKSMQDCAAKRDTCVKACP